MHRCRYDCPETLEHALALLSDAAGEAHLLAGGVALGILMNERLIEPEWLIDISRLDELGHVAREGDGGLRIGALVTHRQLERSPQIRDAAPVLVEMYREVACDRIKNRGTVGGNICLGDPQADLPVALLALDASLGVIGVNGRRQVAARDFFVDLYTTALAEDEMLADIQLPAPPANSGAAYAKFGARRAMDYSSTISVALQLRCDPATGAVTEASVAAGGTIDVRPIRLETTSALLRGCTPCPDMLPALRDALARDIAPEDDHVYSAEYKRHVVGILLARALRGAYRRAMQGEP